MFCSQCGKRVGDAMLFCPFCGQPIVIPEQEEQNASPEPEPADNARKPDEAAQESVPEANDAPRDGEGIPEESTLSGSAEDELLAWSREREDAIDEWSRHAEPEEAFVPLKLDDGEEQQPDWREQLEQKKQAAAPEKKPPEMRRGEEDPVHLNGAAPKLELDVKGARKAGEKKVSRKHANTLVPPKTMNPNDIFMDGNAPEEDYDDYEGGDYQEYGGGFVYEDEGESSFFMRHLRGIVGLALFAILVLLFVIFAFSKAGQQSLAKVNLAWSTEAYSQLGYQSYQAGLYGDAGMYYERALQRSPNDYSFASSAAMAYYEANQTEKAAEMLKRCAEINPTLLEPYIYLLKLYPDAAQRPWDITQLLQQGYQQTGDQRLNVTG